MIDRRLVLSSAVASLIVFAAAPSLALDLQPYEAMTAQKLIKSGKPVIVHVYAPWCLQCRAQASILKSLPGNPDFSKISFFRVAYDDQKEVVSALNCPRSTIIAYKGGKEVARMSWGTSEEDVVRTLKAAL
ncbi:MAG: thioredoxin family protein [Beijerinckiaceae bacterium]|nr:thioredoxin family protein [Beijerinckiaceae bacterium]